MKHLLILLLLFGIVSEAATQPYAVVLLQPHHDSRWMPPKGIRAIIGTNASDHAGYLMALGNDFYLLFAYEYVQAPSCLARNLSPPFDRKLVPDQPTTWWWHLSDTRPGDLIMWECYAR